MFQPPPSRHSRTAASPWGCVMCQGSSTCACFLGVAFDFGRKPSLGFSLIRDVSHGPSWMLRTLCKNDFWLLEERKRRGLGECCMSKLAISGITVKHLKWQPTNNSSVFEHDVFDLFEPQFGCLKRERTVCIFFWHMEKFYFCSDSDRKLRNDDDDFCYLII